MIFDTLWVAKYAPTKLADVALSKENRELFESFRKAGSIPRIAFFGHPGIGKTTTAKILVKEILDCQYLYINASDESGIDIIRTKVTGFAQTKSIDGKVKVIILDEVDGLTMDAQRALRNVMEEYSQICRFIVTANYQHRIIEAIQSRCDPYDLTPPLEEVITRLKAILKKENVKYSDKDVEELARDTYPDMRVAINRLQRYNKNGVLTIPTLAEAKEFIDQIFKLLKLGQVLKLRKWVIENEIKFGGDYPNLLRSLFNYVYEQSLDGDTKRKFLIIVSEYIYRSATVLDQEINAYTCFLQLSEIPSIGSK